MLRDAWLVVVKEYREVLLRMGSVKGNLFNMALILGLFGILMPLQAGREWVRQPLMPLAFMWLPLFLVSALVADSFAGERERHTLETLLTTALSDSSILLGKLGAAVLYGYSLLLVVMVTSLVTVNLAVGTWRHPLLYRADVATAIVVFGLLITLLIGGIGVLVSLKAPTVRQAGQALSLGILGIVTLPAVTVGYGFSRLPDALQQSVLEWLMAADVRLIVVGAGLVLAAVDGILLILAWRRFRRARLVFD